ncbi:hypothetical protein FRC18_006123 [Serendipita sp. 400]|nr:hypothetical protein FRC18_006123 [Serendipita sp. 400]
MLDVDMDEAFRLCESEYVVSSHSKEEEKRASAPILGRQNWKGETEKEKQKIRGKKKRKKEEKKQGSKKGKRTPNVTPQKRLFDCVHDAKSIAPHHHVEENKGEEGEGKGKGKESGGGGRRESGASFAVEIDTPTLGLLHPYMDMYKRDIGH